MGVKVHPSWPGWYVLDISQGKKSRKRVNYEGSYDEAQREYWRLKQKTAKIVTSTSRIGDHVGDFVTWYGLTRSPGTVTDFWYAWKQLEPHFGHLHFHHLDTQQIDRYKAKRLQTTYLPGNPHKDGETAEDKLRRKPVSKRTITRELAYLSSLMKWARQNGYTQHDVIIRGFPKKQTKAPIPVTHTFDEVQRTIEATKSAKRSGPDVYGLTILMYDAGLRRKEARLITAERVELPPEPVIRPDRPPYYGHITVIRKGGKEQWLPILTERLYQELKARKGTRQRGYLYINPMTGKPYRDIRGALKGSAARAGITKRMTNHLLRHDFTTHLHEGGADMKTAQTLLGHADISTTFNIYAHLENSNLAQLAGGFASKVDKHTRPADGVDTEK